MMVPGGDTFIIPRRKPYPDDALLLPRAEWLDCARDSAASLLFIGHRGVHGALTSGPVVAAILPCVRAQFVRIVRHCGFGDLWQLSPVKLERKRKQKALHRSLLCEWVEERPS